MACAIYLRKSREDREAEARGEGETLSRHRTALLELAKNRMLDIGAIYEEIVSGDTIAARPKMQQLLEEVEDGRWDGVLVMEVERLARGNGIDQGIVSQAFSVSGTKIITPYKTYDPSNEMDEDYFEFGLFMSRREFQTIRRRLVAGRIASVKEGKYMGKNDPFGYRRVKLQGEKGWTLEIVPEQAEIVRKIYEWYLEESGMRQVQRRLLSAGYKTGTGLTWEQPNMLALLRNPLYCGYVTWGRKKSERHVKNGQVVKKRRFTKEYVMARGRHEPIIQEDMWNAVQKKLDETPGIKIPYGKIMRNPYQGILYCECGHKMQLTTTTKHRKGCPPEPYYGLYCPSVSCRTVSSRMHAMDESMEQAMRSWVENAKAQQQEPTDQTEASCQKLQAEITAAENEIRKIEAQLKRAFELVEQDVYTVGQFVSRRDDLNARKENQMQRIETLTREIDNLQSEVDLYSGLIPRMQYVIDAFPMATVEERHEMLLSVFDRIVYRKAEEPGVRKQDLTITLTLFPKIRKR